MQVHSAAAASNLLSELLPIFSINVFSIFSINVAIIRPIQFFYQTHDKPPPHPHCTPEAKPSYKYAAPLSYTPAYFETTIEVLIKEQGLHHHFTIIVMVVITIIVILIIISIIIITVDI